MTEKFKNPVLESGADPFVTLFEGKYYYVYAEGNGTCICVSCADNINRLNHDGKCIFEGEPEGMCQKEIWAPEIHYINGDWYCYFAADDGKNVNHRMYVAKSTDKTPDGKYELIGKITDKTDLWAIDGTVLPYKGKMYFIWSGWDEVYEHRQNIYIAEMDSPVSVSSERVCISVPEYDWEKKGGGITKSGKHLPSVNEGPQVLVKGDTVHVVYSAAGSWSRYYCLGILTYRNGNIMDPASWVKGAEPVFSENDGAHGTGHCSFTMALDGTTDFIIYHACRTPNGGWAGRGVRAQSFTWDNDMPVFGAAKTPDEWVELPAAE